MKHISDYSQPYSPTEIQLAHEIAERLHDPAAMSQFLRYAQQYPHEFLREALNKACSTPDRAVRSSRAAIFVHIVKNYSQYYDGDSWN